MEEDYIEEWLADGLNYLNRYNPEIIRQVRIYRVTRLKRKRMTQEQIFDFEMDVLRQIADGSLRADKPPYLLALWKVRGRYEVFCRETGWRVDVSMPDIGRADFEQWCAKSILESLDL